MPLYAAKPVVMTIVLDYSGGATVDSRTVSSEASVTFLPLPVAVLLGEQHFHRLIGKLFNTGTYRGQLQVENISISGMLSYTTSERSCGMRRRSFIVNWINEKIWL
jgi:hypothetical protein